MVVPMNVNRFLNRTARLYANKTAVVDQDMSYTYAEMYERVQRLSRALKGCGIKPGDRVAWLGYNNHPLLEAYFGVVQFGAILVPLNIRLAVTDLIRIIEDCSPSLLVFDSDFDTVARQLMDANPGMELIEIQIEGSHPQYQSYESFLAQAPDLDQVPEYPEIDENQVAEIFYTSGTTGMPKGVGLTYRNLFMNAMQVLISGDVGDDAVILHTIPLFHVNGWGTPHYITAIGGTHIMLRRFIPDVVLSLVEKHRVTHASLVPTMANFLNQAAEQHAYDLSSWRYMTFGGAPSPSSFVQVTMDHLGAEYVGGYGLSETSPLVSMAVIKDTLASEDPALLNQYRGTAGIPAVGVEVAIVDEQDRELPWDGTAVGELKVRGDVVMQGYWNKPEETAKVIRNGWFFTGDMASIDPEGYIRIVDRKKDIIISGGENISSVELEDALYRHPAVFECCVIGVPDAKWGEVPKAVVVLKPGMQATQEELMNFANSNLASFKVIKALDFALELPKTGTGKIQKTKVRKDYGGGWFNG
ncbi:MAG: O-succinylbenzoate--CoA ligase [Sulfobacillus benefaciens]|uniref:O-succinylbenzoate--CoA ligase n=1 Tax=Sulfobacillus benefaciens TaxID=453960 RepID=A0A2T2X728_9FIRM|nr:MAG: O-succinylbenzoate--CoA ligase [Sulfobacillus benefaciens]